MVAMIYQMKTKLYVLVLNYRHYSDTANCIKAILHSDFPSDGTVLILDNSDDSSGQEQLRQEFGKNKKVRLVKNKVNLGFAGGNNTGLKMAVREGGSHVLIINPDVTIPKSFFKPLLKTMNTTGAAIVAPCIRHQVNGKTYFGLEGSVDWRLAKPTHINVTKRPTPKLRRAEFVTFACVLIDIKTIKSVGLLDDSYFMYLEDVDYCLRVGGQDQKIFCDPKIIVEHRTSSSFANPTQKLPISFRSHLIFIRKWLSPIKQIRPLFYTLVFYPYLFLLWSAQAIKRRYFPKNE